MKATPLVLLPRWPITFFGQPTRIDRLSGLSPIRFRRVTAAQQIVHAFLAHIDTTCTLRREHPDRTIFQVLGFCHSHKLLYNLEAGKSQLDNIDAVVIARFLPPLLPQPLLLNINSCYTGLENVS